MGNCSRVFLGVRKKVRYDTDNFGSNYFSAILKAVFFAVFFFCFFFFSDFPSLRNSKSSLVTPLQYNKQSQILNGPQLPSPSKE